MTPKITLERYAELSAELDTGELRDELLARENIAEADWLNAQQYWLQSMGLEATRNRYELAHRYSSLFLKARKAAVTRKAKKRQVVAPNSVREQPLSGREVPRQQEASAPLMQGLGVASTDGPRLTLAQWAAFCAELAVYATNADAIRQRYGFDDATFSREQAQWENLFASDRSVFDEYLGRFRHYRDWFLGAAAR